MSGWIAMLALAAFTSGLMGGVHCSAMCGALSGMACGRGPAMNLRLVSAAHAGRLASYSTAGALAGALGQAGLTLRGGIPAQQVLLFVTGATLLLAALYQLRAGRIALGLEAAGAVLWRVVSPVARHVLPADTVGKAAGMGVLWGWLPCGMVYAALMLAMATGGAITGALVMLAFGAGTLPALILAHGLVRRFKAALNRRAVRLSAGALLGSAGAWAIAHALHPALPGALQLFCRVTGIPS